jgi:hypothetical protein
MLHINLIGLACMTIHTEYVVSKRKAGLFFTFSARDVSQYLNDYVGTSHNTHLSHIIINRERWE